MMKLATLRIYCWLWLSIWGGFTRYKWLTPHNHTDGSSNRSHLLYGLMMLSTFWIVRSFSTRLRGSIPTRLNDLLMQQVRSNVRSCGSFKWKVWLPSNILKWLAGLLLNYNSHLSQWAATSMTESICCVTSKHLVPTVFNIFICTPRIKYECTQTKPSQEGFWKYNVDDFNFNYSWESENPWACRRMDSQGMVRRHVDSIWI